MGDAQVTLGFNTQSESESNDLDDLGVPPWLRNPHININIYIYTPTNILINIPVSPFTHPLHPTEVTWAIHDLHGNAGWWSLELMEKLQKTITFLGGQLWICVDFLIMMLDSGSPLKIGIARGILKFTGSMWASWNWRIQSHDNANQYKRSHRY